MTKKHNGVNPVNGKNAGQDTIYQRTRLQRRGDVGMPVARKYQKRPELSRFIEHRKRPCDGLITMTEDQILAAVLNDQLFGALEVDLHIPDHLKPTFAEMSPIFKNVEVSRDDIGDHMRKSLVGSMFGLKIMIITPLLKWYLIKELVVTRIYQVVEYSPAKCFQTFGEAVSDARRAGDADPNKKL